MIFNSLRLDKMTITFVKNLFSKKTIEMVGGTLPFKDTLELHSVPVYTRFFILHFVAFLQVDRGVLE